MIAALYSAQETLGREINPKIFRKNEWVKRRDGKDAFIKDVLAKPCMDVMGDENGLG